MKDITVMPQFKIAVHLLIIPIIIFCTLSISGCVSTSPGIPGIYLFKLESSTNGTLPPRSDSDNSASISIAYFGLCLTQGSHTTCLSSSGSSSKDISKHLNETASGTGLPKSIEPLLQPALALQSEVFTCMLGLAGLVFLAGIILLGALNFSLYRTRTVEFKSIALVRRHNLLRQASMALIWISNVFAFAGTYAVMQSQDALKVQSKYWLDGVDISTGTTVLVLHWLTFVFILAFTAGISAIHRSRSADLQQASKEGIPYGDA
ncbi:hypothetical protein F5884DRAFT_851373 [Xylogone sp. PMI_703]|nr:hypothetical protein F5884DRAFT_851373 [Xylogone sp. PMI_703]